MLKINTVNKRIDNSNEITVLKIPEYFLKSLASRMMNIGKTINEYRLNAIGDANTNRSWNISDTIDR